MSPSASFESDRGHSITLSARAIIVDGTSRPSAVAVLRLMANSNLVGCSTGKSAGFTPLSIRSTYLAALRNIAGQLGPYDISAPASTYTSAGTIVGIRLVIAMSAI